MTTPDPLLTLEQVAEITQIPIGTVRKWPSQGGGPVCLKLGGRVRVRESDLTAWIDSCVLPAEPRSTGATASD